MESDVQISPEYLCGVPFFASNAKVGNPALDCISACLSPHPSNATHRSPEMANSSPRGRPIAVFPWPAPHAQLNLFPQEKPVPVLKPKAGSQNRLQATRRKHVFTPAQPFNYESTCRVFFFAKASVLTLPLKKLHFKISPVKPTGNRKK